MIKALQCLGILFLLFTGCKTAGDQAKSEIKGVEDSAESEKAGKAGNGENEYARCRLSLCPNTNFCCVYAPDGSTFFSQVGGIGACNNMFQQCNGSGGKSCRVRLCPNDNFCCVYEPNGSKYFSVVGGIDACTPMYNQCNAQH